ncbi:MAG: hypothetical protein K9K75_05050 [Deltaproteobacteria bacterium]|nr:hypothetical protein [Deltaproteobacteria bacterium]
MKDNNHITRALSQLALPVSLDEFLQNALKSLVSVPELKSWIDVDW